MRDPGPNTKASMLILAVAVSSMNASLVTGATSPGVADRTLSASLPAFDEISIALSEPTADPAVHSRFSNTKDGSFSAMTATIHDLIWFANEIDGTRVAGGPDWVRTARYEIRAKAKPIVNSDGVQEPVPFKLMARSLLRDKFSLRTHVEKRELPVFVMTVENDETVRNAIVPSPEAPIGTSPDAQSESIGPSGDGLTFKNSSMRTLTELLTRRLGRPVVDESGVTGKRDFRLPRLDLIMIDYGKNSPERDTILRETVGKALGMKLELRTRPMDVIVIDSIQLP